MYILMKNHASVYVYSHQTPCFRTLPKALMLQDVFGGGGGKIHTPFAKPRHTLLRCVIIIVRSTIIISHTHAHKVLWLGKEQCAVTWEPAENIPSVIVDEFERGTVIQVKDEITPGIGQDMHTISAEPSQKLSLI